MNSLREKGGVYAFLLVYNPVDHKASVIKIANYDSRIHRSFLINTYWTFNVLETFYIGGIEDWSKNFQITGLPDSIQIREY